MNKTASPYYLYEEGEVVDDTEYTVFECARWQSYRSVLTSTIDVIVGVMIACRENWASVAKNALHILRLKKRDLDAAECVSDGVRNRDLDQRNSGDT